MPRKSKSQPVQAASGQAYGERAKQEAAQQAIPLPDTTGITPMPIAPQPAPPIPGMPGGMDRPSARPGEPVTAGLPIGAGPGPEILQAAENPNTELARNLQGYMPALEVLANLPSSSVQTRNFVRRIRGLLPMEGQ